MKDSQARIQAIQERLQAINAGQGTGQQTMSSPQPSPMVELTPHSRPMNPAPLAASPLVNEVDEWELRSPQSDSPRLTSLMEPPLREPSATAYPDSGLTAQVETLSQRANAYVQQRQQPKFQQPLPQPSQFQTSPVAPDPAYQWQQAQQHLEQRRTEILQRLDAQVNHIHQLSTAQETALHDLKAIADRAEHDLKALVLDGELPPAMQLPIPTLELETATVPHVQKGQGGKFIVTARSVNLSQAEHDAVLMAELLRNRSQSADYRTHLQPSPRRRPRHPNSYDDPQVWLRWLRQQVQAWVKLLNPPAPSLKSAPTKPSRLGHAPAESPAPLSLTVQEALVWLIGAIAARIGINVVLHVFPWLWVPVIGLIMVPVAIAVYKATTSPHAGFIWGCRLLLMMIGLLIGGRLM